VRKRHLFLASALWLAACGDAHRIDDSGPVAGWDHWGNDAGGQRHSPLTQITPDNVGRLHVAWTYRIGAVGDQSPAPTPAAEASRMLAEGMAPEGMKYPALESTPILVENRLYLCSSRNKVVALDPETGREIWAHDPQVDMRGLHLLNCRGVTYYLDAQAAEGAACRGRIITGTLDGRLIELDAATGEPCKGFGRDGALDLRAGLGRNRPGDYAISSPPVVVGDVVIVGGRIEDSFRTDMPAGVIRAFDVRTGEFAWAWNPLPPGTTDADSGDPSEPYVRATPNAWSVFSVDSERGLVYVPTGNVQVDLYGGDRGGAGHPERGRDYYSSSVVALEAATGHVVWHFQTVHHDIWDYDVPSQPVLFELPQADGTKVPALVQGTKRGELFLLDRRTGAPLAEVREQAVPQGAVPGDWTAKTQPFSVGMPQFRGADLTETDMWGLTPLDQLWCRIEFRKLRYEGHFTPPTLTGTLQYPGNAGGFNWGSVAIDEDNLLMVVNPLVMSNRLQLYPRDQIPEGVRVSAQAGTPYAMTTRPFMSPLFVPCQKPPYGTLGVVDLKTRTIVWNKPVGTTNESGPFGIGIRLSLPMGVPQSAGTLVTKGGLIFIGGTMDRYFRAFDLHTGEELWHDYLPATAQATPMSYLAPKSQRQVVVLTVPNSSRRFGIPQRPGAPEEKEDEEGGHIVAYALPQT
jgi:membrane-bound PQQ-dependent dehydrogenase (glucose/quinate/shikimate family)